MSANDNSYGWGILLGLVSFGAFWAMVFFFLLAIAFFTDASYDNGIAWIMIGFATGFLLLFSHTFEKAAKHLRTGIVGTTKRFREDIQLDSKR